MLIFEKIYELITTLKTKRLQLRQTNVSDAAFTLELLNTKEWIDNIGDRGVTTIEQAQNYIKEKVLPQYKEHGYGNFTVLLDGEAIGNTGVYIRKGMEYPDLGFAFLPRYFGKGYAFEASEAVIQFIVMNTNIKKLQAITLPSNSASLHLLNKLGFVSLKRFYLEGDSEELVLLELNIRLQN